MFCKHFIRDVFSNTNNSLIIRTCIVYTIRIKPLPLKQIPVILWNLKRHKKTTSSISTKFLKKVDTK